MISNTIIYDWSWKQNVILDDDQPTATEKTFFFLNDSNSDEELNSIHDEDYDDPMKPADEAQIKYIDLQYQNEAGLQLYLSVPDASQLLQWLLPFETVQHFTESLNNRLLTIIEKDLASEATLVFNKKKFKDSELQIWLGLHVWFGLYRFPELRDYWHSEIWMRGGIEICMQEGRFKFIDANCLDSKCSITIISEIKKKFRKMYKPDQELILVKNNQCTLYLFDSKSFFVLDLVLVFNAEEQDNLILKMLEPYVNQNHIVFFAPNLLNNKLTRKLYEYKLFPIGIVDVDPLNYIEGLYESTSGLMQKNENGKLMFYPKIQLKDIYNVYNKIILKASQRVTFIEVFQSRFFKNQSYPYEDTYHVRITFEEYFEGAIYNIFTYLNTILNKNEMLDSYKDFRTEIGKILTGEKGQQLEKDRNDIKHRKQLKVESKEVQSDKLSLGLLQTFDPEQFHTPFCQPNNQTVKYCLVCMKYDGLSKSYFRCLVCEKLMQQGRIHLCLFPCFELFHRNPSEFLNCDLEYLQSQGEDKYFKKFNPLQVALIETPPIVQQPNLNLINKKLILPAPRGRGRIRGGLMQLRQMRRIEKKESGGETFDRDFKNMKVPSIERPFSMITPKKQQDQKQVSGISSQPFENRIVQQQSFDKFKPIQQINYTVVNPSEKERYKLLKEQKIAEKLYGEITSKDQDSLNQAGKQKYQLLRSQPIQVQQTVQSQQAEQSQIQTQVQEETKSPFEIFMDQVKKKKTFTKIETIDQS